MQDSHSCDPGSIPGQCIFFHTNFLFSSENDSIVTVLGATNNDRSFSSLAEVVSEKTLRAVSEMGFTEMMEIQFKSIRPLLEGR